MIMGSACSHKPTKEGWRLGAAVPCQLASPRVRQYALQYRSIRVPTGCHALYTRSYRGEGLSAHHWGAVGVSVRTVRRTLSVVYNIIPIGCCDGCSVQQSAGVS